MKLHDIYYHSIIGTLKGLARLPLPMLYGFSDLAHLILYKGVKYRVKVVRKNLTKSFPEKSQSELMKIEHEFYKNLCDVFIEAIKLLHISDKELNRRIIPENIEILQEECNKKGSVILFLGHYGNWEWVPDITLHEDRSLLLGELYKPLRNKLMDQVMTRIRSRFGSVQIIHRTAYRTLLGYKRDNRKFVVGFIADQRPIGGPLNHWTTFMNQPTAFMTGGETIGEKIGSGYVYVEMLREKRGHYRMSFTKMEADPQDLAPYPYTRLFLAMLEESIRKSPSSWLWSHNKWKSALPPDANILPPAKIPYRS